MNFFENLIDDSTSDSDNDELNDRQRVYRPRINFCIDDFVMRFRLPKRAIENIVNLIGPYLAHPMDKNYAINPEHYILLTIRYLATNGFMSLFVDAHGLSKATVSRVVHRVVTVINREFFDKLVKFPDNLTEFF